MNRRPSPRTRPRLAWALLALAPLWAAQPAEAQTLLTNGSQVRVAKGPAPVLTTVNGDEGYAILVPPGATRLVVEFQTWPNWNVELMVRGNLDVGIAPESGVPTIGNDRGDFFVHPNNLGMARIEIGPTDHPPLVPGIYYIGFLRVVDEGVNVEGFLRATVSGGPVEELFPVVQSTFEDGPDGWSRAASTGGIPGASIGDPGSAFFHFTARGNPGGFVAIRDIAMGESEFFVAPPKFHVNLLALDDGRIEFDLSRINGSSDVHFFTEVRVFGDDGGWSWTGYPPPPIPENFDFWTQSVPPIWMTVSVPVRRDLWRKIAGEPGQAGFEKTMSNPKRIEIRATYDVSGGTNGIDNVRIRARGKRPATDVLPTVTGFSSGFENWTRNHPENTAIAGSSLGDASSTLLWSDVDGNPGGKLTLAETGDAGGPLDDAFVAPQEYLGIYTGLLTRNARFEFDYRHESFGGAMRPVTIRLFGADSIFEWSGAPPIGLWSRQTAPLREGDWQRTAGTASFAAAMANVVRIELSADHAEGRERNSLDNFSLLTDDTPPLPRSITVLPGELRFSAAATEPPPAAQRMEISASGPPARWGAEVTGAIAGRVRLSQSTGEPPAIVEVSVDTEGLAPGDYPFEIVVRALGTTLAPRVVQGRLLLTPQPRPAPRLSQGSVVNAATFRPQLAAGALATAFGEAMGGPAAGVFASLGGPRGDQAPTELNGVRVLVYETWESLIAEAPVLFLNDRQVNFQMPFEAAGRSAVRIVVAAGGARSVPVDVQMVPSSPGVFAFGASRAAALNEDGSLNSASNPQSRTKPMTVFLTGQGIVAPEWASGRVAGVSPLIFAPAAARAYIGGVEAKVTFLGLAPGMVGVAQMNLEPGFFTPTGDRPLIVNLNGHESVPVTVTIR